MSQFMPKIALLLHPLVLAIVLAYSYNWVRRITATSFQRNAVMGSIFAVATTVAMLNPFVLSEGVIIDLRNLIIGLAAAFFGLVGMVITVTAAIWLRFELGGLGMVPGFIGICVAGVMGLLWAYAVRQRIANNLFAIAVLGVMISAHLVAGFWLPQDMATQFFSTFAPLLLIFNLIGAVLIGILITYEENSLTHQDNLLFAANTDPLTKLLNRRSIIERFNALLKKGNGRGTAMLCFDIDHFKQINDRHGHLSGDEVIVEITRRIAACLRPTDLFSRIGGDEFVIVLPDITETETALVAERCRAAVSSAPFIIMDKTLHVSVSIGAHWTSFDRDFNVLLATTDQALYNAKALGRDCVAFNLRGPSRFAPPMAREVRHASA